MVGLAVGGLMVAAPKGIWWTTQAWKFRHPEANEPSDVSYGMTRIGGVLLAVVALFFGFGSISSEREQAAAQRAKQTEANFKPPAPEQRGQLPLLGYLATPAPDGQHFIDVYYVAPAEG